MIFALGCYLLEKGAGIDIRWPSRAHAESAEVSGR